MSLMIYASLREANIARQKEWDTGNQMSLSYSGNELAGEVGEAIEAAWHAPLDDTGPLADELGDVVICCDLLAMRYDITLNYLEWDCAPIPFDNTKLASVVLDMAMDTGRACNVVKKLDRELLGMNGSRATADDLASHLKDILWGASDVAALFGLRLSDCVAAKFNKTSEKVGLITRYDPKSSEPPKITPLQLVTAHEWEGIYLDGKLVAEGHAIALLDAFTIATGPVQLLPTLKADDVWLSDRGGFPHDLNEVRFEA